MFQGETKSSEIIMFFQIIAQSNQYQLHVKVQNYQYPTLDSIALVNQSSNNMFCHSLAVNLAPKTKAPFPQRAYLVKIMPGLPWNGQEDPVKLVV